jgi:hypothetical protein
LLIVTADAPTLWRVSGCVLQRLYIIAVLTLCLMAGFAQAAKQQNPDATPQLKGGSFAAGVGFIKCRCGISVTFSLETNGWKLEKRIDHTPF